MMILNNKILYIYIVILFFSIFPNSVIAQENTVINSNYINLLENPDSFRSQYEEIKYLPSLPNGIKSKGDFVFVKDTGIMWSMKTPFIMQTVIGKNGLSQWIDGKKQYQSKDTQKMMDPIFTNIFSIYSGNFGELSEHFVFYDIPAEEGKWNLKLTPSSLSMKPYIQEINLYGSNYIEDIKIVFSQDKYTNIHYTKPQIGASYITREEYNLFDQ